MFKRQQRAKGEDLGRVEQLLGVLGHVSEREPSPDLRERLARMAAERLRAEPEPGWRLGRAGLIWTPGLRIALACALLVVMGAGVAYLAHIRNSLPIASHAPAGAEPPANGLRQDAVPVPKVARARGRHGKSPHARPEPSKRSGAQQITMQLPYSNDAIRTGTAATLRVAMSRSELLSLGFPVGPTVDDGRVVAELTLGDDGLPRAISLPLPLTWIKEKR